MLHFAVLCCLILFKKAYKKLHSNQLAEVNKAIGKVIKNPGIGEQKKGNLSWLRVYKFKVLGQLTLLGYSYEKNGDIILTGESDSLRLTYTFPA